MSEPLTPKRRREARRLARQGIQITATDILALLDALAAVEAERDDYARKIVEVKSIRDRMEKAERQVAAVKALADKWAEYAAWSQRGGPGTGGANRPRMYWDVAAHRLRAVLDPPRHHDDDYEPLPTGRALLDWWLPQLSGAEKKIVTALDEHGPMEKVDLAAATGYEPTGGGFNNPLGHLRTLGIITPAKVTPIELAPEMSD